MVGKKIEVGRLSSPSPMNFAAGITLPRAMPAKSGAAHSTSSILRCRSHARIASGVFTSEAGDSSRLICGVMINLWAALGAPSARTRIASHGAGRIE